MFTCKFVNRLCFLMIAFYINNDKKNNLKLNDRPRALYYARSPFFLQKNFKTENAEFDTFK